MEVWNRLCEEVKQCQAGGTLNTGPTFGFCEHTWEKQVDIRCLISCVSMYILFVYFL